MSPSSDDVVRVVSAAEWTPRTPTGNVSPAPQPPRAAVAALTGSVSLDTADVVRDVRGDSSVDRQRREVGCAGEGRHRALDRTEHDRALPQPDRDAGRVELGSGNSPAGNSPA